MHDIDLRISQELPGLFGKGKAEVWLDVLDIGNPIDKDRGHVEEVLVSGFGRPQGPGVVEYGGIDAAAGKSVYRFNTPDTGIRRDTVGRSRWALQVGVHDHF